jgi:hypothetical protein
MLLRIRDAFVTQCWTRLYYTLSVGLRFHFFVVFSMFGGVGVGSREGQDPDGEGSGGHDSVGNRAY